MKIKKIVATTHEARLVRPDGGRGRFGLVVAVAVVVGMVGPSAMASGGGGVDLNYYVMGVYLCWDQRMCMYVNVGCA